MVYICDYKIHDLKCKAPLLLKQTWKQLVIIGTSCPRGQKPLKPTGIYNKYKTFKNLQNDFCEYCYKPNNDFKEILEVTCV